MSDHAHRWKLETPQPGMREVAGECACGAQKTFPAFSEGSYAEISSNWQERNARVKDALLGRSIEPRRWWS